MSEPEAAPQEGSEPPPKLDEAPPASPSGSAKGSESGSPKAGSPKAGDKPKEGEGEKPAEGAEAETREENPPVSPSKGGKVPFTSPKLKQNEIEAKEQVDTHFYFLGDKGCGKSTLINHFTRATAPSKMTQGLEYQFVKKEDDDAVKCAHFWKLGGGRELVSLLDVMMTPSNVNEVVAVICVDLSSPSTVFDTVHFWLTRIRKRVGVIFKQMSANRSQTPGRMMRRMKKQVGVDHPDVEKMMIIGVPIIIIPTHYDKFSASAEPLALKIMARTLRHLSHTFAASLIYTTSVDEREASRVRTLLQTYAWSGTPPNLAPQTDPAKPIFLMAGKDTYKGIGKPADYDPPANFVSVGHQSDFDRWKIQFENLFPKKEEVEEEDQFNVWSSEFAEPEIDKKRKEKENPHK